MKIYLDTAEIAVVRDAFSLAHFDGITTNPRILAEMEYKYGSPLLDLKVLSKFLSDRRSELHVSVISTEYQGILEDARAIRRELGDSVYIKIPVTRAGLAAIRVLSQEGVNITATCVYSFEEAILAYSAGASVALMYYSRLVKQKMDPDKVITLTRKAYPEKRLMVSDFSSYDDLERAVEAGAEELAIAPEVYLLHEENPETLADAHEFAELWKERLGSTRFLID